MSVRVQVIVSVEEREALRRRAIAEGVSLSAWIRDAALDRMTSVVEHPLSNPENLRRFFESLPDQEGEEPDWEVTKALIAEETIRGLPQP